MFKKIAIALVAVTPLLGACDTTQQAGQKETIGTVAGAVLGGIIGSKVGKGEGQLWATGAGAVLGGILGSSIGRGLDEQDKAMMDRTSQAALEHTTTGSVSSWKNPDSGHSGTVAPTRTYQRTDGTYCREFEQYVTVDGVSERATGTACRQDDGSWKIVE